MARMERRALLKSAAATGIAAVAGPAFAQTPSASSPVEAPGMLYRTLGKTGERVSAIGLGGANVGTQATQAESIQLIRSAIDRGITFMDNSWDYNGGLSEVRMGLALAGGYRQKVFLMTKMDGRTKDSYNKQLEESMGRLHTDMIDLVQFHEVIRMEDPDRIFAEGGAIEAAVAARQAGKIRYIGFTGHKDPAVHLRMLEVAKQHNFHFDAVQMPINVMDAHFRSFAREVMPLANEQGIAVLAMKTFGGGLILKSKTAEPIEMLHYSLSQPVSVVITGIDRAEILDQAIEAVRTFKPMTQEQTAALLARTRDAANTGRFERFKTNTDADATARNPQWLG